MKRTDRYFRTAKIDALTALTLAMTSASILCWMPVLTSKMGDARVLVEWTIAGIVGVLMLVAAFSAQGAIYHFRMAQAAVRADRQYEPRPRL